MSEMVERATKAAEHVRIDCYGTDEEIARAVISAMREPTAAMVRAANDGSATPPYVLDTADKWRAMVDAALTDSRDSGGGTAK